MSTNFATTVWWVAFLFHVQYAPFVRIRSSRYGRIFVSLVALWEVLCRGTVGVDGLETLLRLTCLRQTGCFSFCQNISFCVFFLV